MKIQWRRTLTYSAGKAERDGWGWDWFLEGWHNGKMIVCGSGSAPSRPAARNNARKSRAASMELWREYNTPREGN